MLVVFFGVVPAGGCIHHPSHAVNYLGVPILSAILVLPSIVANWATPTSSYSVKSAHSAPPSDLMQLRAVAAKIIEDPLKT
jgi:hypothetical protein